MKKLKYLIFLIVIFITPNIFAAEFTMNNYTSATLNGTKNRYRGTEIYNTGISNTYTFGTQYSGRLSDIEVYFDYPFSANTTYRFTYNMNTDDFRNKFSNSYWWDCSNGNENDMTNINVHVVNTSYINMKKVQVSLTPSADTTCIRLWLRSTNLSNTAITGVSNWRLNTITIYDPDWQNGTTSGTGSQGTTNGSTTGTTASNPNGEIIDNANQNTQDIIDNANQNTQDIIDSNKVCSNKLLDKSSIIEDNYRFGTTGNLIGYNGTGLTDYYVIDKDTTIQVKKIYSDNYALSRFCFYTSNKTYISCDTLENYSLNDYLTFPTNANYVRFQFVKADNSPQYDYHYCKNGNQAISESINDTNSYLKDDTDPNINDSEFTNLFNSVGFNDPLGYLLQLPVQFINQLVSQSDVCQTISLGTLWGVSITMPCIDIGSIIGQQVWDIIDVLFSIGLLVVIFKNLYQTFANLMTMGGEKEAREKFSMPTPMEFLSIILGGDR